ncbi:hypothetical protein K0M31_001267 [Melipona bicolor]|uniref:Uncharacterized protein n=1 Tax=Melipona bicolor TaxID=60889 RepID=A0AA40KXN6_9HYME|nr:hypothetical protein K0M31_001267 [Melipona bicolor]
MVCSAIRKVESLKLYANVTKSESYATKGQATTSVAEGDINIKDSSFKSLNRTCSLTNASTHGLATLDPTIATHTASEAHFDATDKGSSTFTISTGTTRTNISSESNGQ